MRALMVLVVATAAGASLVTANLFGELGTNRLYEQNDAFRRRRERHEAVEKARTEAFEARIEAVGAWLDEVYPLDADH